MHKNMKYDFSTINANELYDLIVFKDLQFITKLQFVLNVTSKSLKTFREIKMTEISYDDGKVLPKNLYLVAICISFTVHSNWCGP